MDRQALPAAAAEPDFPIRASEIRRPSRSEKHDMRAEREARA